MIPCVSVVMITYCHENFISKAIEGVLKQQTNFQIEFIIANDNSPDNSDFIIKQSLKNYPDHITVKYTKQSKNLGMINNFIWALNQAKGEFIAICEGDDYWTDSLKLEKQVNFLIKNPEFSISFHSVNEINEQNTYLRRLPIDIKKNKLSIRDLSKRNFIPTLSVVFRNNSNDYTFLNKYLIGDYPLLMMKSSEGLIHFHKEVMGVYRTNVGVFSSSKKYLQREIVVKTIQCLLDNMTFQPEIYQILNKQKSILLYMIYKEKSRINFFDEQRNLFNNNFYGNISTLVKIKFFIKQFLKK
ncbi:glycosyltransferase [Empedobacter falsenii]